MNVLEVHDLGVRFVLRRIKHTTLTETVVRAFTRRNAPPVKPPPAVREELWALRHVTFSVRTGESVGIIGRNGAGKSTLLQVLTGIYRPDEGTVERRGRIGLLQLGTGFHPDLSGRDNIYLTGAILGLKRREIQRLYDDIVAFSELERFIDTPIKSYSAGMLTRLGFSIAIHALPDILLIDEVLATGDERFRKKCFARLDEIRDMGRTIVFVSHAMDEVRRLCERALCLDRGRAVFEGPSDEAADFYLERMGGGVKGATAPGPEKGKG